MLKNVEIIHFRGMDNVTIPLKKITLLTGCNGVGKTTVLEALHCLFSPGTLDINQFQRYSSALNINTINSSKGLNFPHPPIVFDYLNYWAESVDKNSRCDVNARNNADDFYSWYAQISNFEQFDDTLKKTVIEYNLLVSSETPLIRYHWDYKIANNKKVVTKSEMDAIQGNPQGGLFSSQKLKAFESTSVYLNDINTRIVPNNLEYEMEPILVDALKLFDNSIDGVRIGKDSINNNKLIVLAKDRCNNITPRSAGSYGRGIEMCAGIVFSIIKLLSIKTQKPVPTLLLVDEICSGLHYSIIHQFWEYIVKLLIQYPELQIVATTHSDDCVRGLCETLSANKDVLQLGSIVRLHKSADDSGVKLTEYFGEKLADILSREWEVRG
jgi:predicted ATP-dependent endonuclease of OLD family